MRDRKLSGVLWAPIVAAFLATIGNGLYTTLSSLQIARLTTDGWLMGGALSIYFLGLTLGTLATQWLILRKGHVQSYRLLILLTIVGTLLQATTDSLWWWLPIRFALGMALGGIFVIYESWINQHSSPTKRAFNLSCYFAVYYLALGLGQIFLQLPMQQVTWLYVVVAGLSALSLCPIVTLSQSNHQTTAPLAVLKLADVRAMPMLGLGGSLVSGMLSGVVISLLPYFLTLREVGHSPLSWLMLATMLSGVLPQLFIARLTRKFRSTTLLWVCCTLIVMAVLAELLPSHAVELVTIASPIIGACVFSIYPISVNMIVDSVLPEKITSANSLTLFSYSFGCVLGPWLCSLWMERSGDEGYLYFLLLFCFALTGALLHNKFQLRKAA